MPQPTPPQPLADERLSAWLDGELTPADRGAFERELSSRPDLQAALAQLTALRESVAALPRVQLGDDFAQRVVAAAVAAQNQQSTAVVQRAPRSVRPAALWGLGLFAAAALVLVVFNLSGFLRSGNNTSPIAPIAELPSQPPTPAAVAALRKHLPAAGEAVVLRLTATDPRLAQRLSQSLAERGVSERPATDLTTLAAEVGRVYRERVRESGQPAGSSASGAIYIEAPLAELEEALAELASAENVQVRPESRVALAALGKPSAQHGEGEGEPGSRSPNTESAPFIQQLNPRLFKLPADSPTAAQPTANPAAPLNPNRKVRVLILLEAAPQS